MLTFYLKSFSPEPIRTEHGLKLHVIHLLPCYVQLLIAILTQIQLVENGMLSKDSYEYLLCRYTEVSGAAADFEMFLVLLAPFLSGDFQPSSGIAVHLPVGEFAADRPMQEVLCKLMISYIKNQPAACSVLIVDDGKCDRGCIIDVLKTLPTAADVHFFMEKIATDCDRDYHLNADEAIEYGLVDQIFNSFEE